MGVDERHLAGIAVAAHHGGHRLIKRVQTWKRPRVVGGLGDPRRMLENVAESGDKCALVHSVEVIERNHGDRAASLDDWCIGGERKVLAVPMPCNLDARRHPYAIEFSDV